MDTYTIKVVGSMIAVMVLVTMGLVSMERNACERFGQLSNRETHFVKYAFLSYDCLTPSGDGKMISTTLLREITD